MKVLSKVYQAPYRQSRNPTLTKKTFPNIANLIIRNLFMKMSRNTVEANHGCRRLVISSFRFLNIHSSTMTPVGTGWTSCPGGIRKAGWPPPPPAHPVGACLANDLKGQSHQILSYILASGKLKLVLFAGQLMVLTFLYVVVTFNWYIQKFIFKLLLYKHLLIVQTLLKAVPKSLFRLTYFAVEHWRVFWVSCLCTVNQVSKSSFVNLLEGFSKLDMTVNIWSSSSAAYRKGFHIHNQLTETRYKLSVSGFSKVLHN
jgi:hypothetical protein